MALIPQSDSFSFQSVRMSVPSPEPLHGNPLWWLALGGNSRGADLDGP